MYYPTINSNNVIAHALTGPGKITNSTKEVKNTNDWALIILYVTE